MPNTDLIDVRLNVTLKAHAAIESMARGAGASLGKAAVHVLTHALPMVQSSWEEYAWPPLRRRNGRGPARTIIVARVPLDLRDAYDDVATDIWFRAVNLGKFSPPLDPVDGAFIRKNPTAWLMRAVLQSEEYRPQLPPLVPEPSRPVRAPGTSNITSGPLVLVVLPARAVRWIDNKRLNRSAFVRTAAETVVPVLAASDTMPPMSRLMPDDTPCRFPVRMSASLHESIKQTAAAKGVSMTHLIRAACLQHLARIATQPKEAA